MAFQAGNNTFFFLIHNRQGATQSFLRAIESFLRGNHLFRIVVGLLALRSSWKLSILMIQSIMPWLPGKPKRISLISLPFRHVNMVKADKELKSLCLLQPICTKVNML